MNRRPLAWYIVLLLVVSCVAACKQASNPTPTDNPGGQPPETTATTSSGPTQLADQSSSTTFVLPGGQTWADRFPATTTSSAAVSPLPSELVWDLNSDALVGQGLLIPHGDRVIIRSFDGASSFVRVTEPTLPVTQVVDDGAGGIVYRVDADLFRLGEGHNSPELVWDPPPGVIPTPLGVRDGALLVLTSDRGAGTWAAQRIQLDTGRVEYLFELDEPLDPETLPAVSDEFVVIRRMQLPPRFLCAGVVDAYLDQCFASKSQSAFPCNWFEIHDLRSPELSRTFPTGCSGNTFLGPPQVSGSTLYFVEQEGKSAGSNVRLVGMDLLGGSRREISIGHGTQRHVNSVLRDSVLVMGDQKVVIKATREFGGRQDQWLIGWLEDNSFRVVGVVDSLGPDQGMTGHPAPFGLPAPEETLDP